MPRISIKPERIGHTRKGFAADVERLRFQTWDLEKQIKAHASTQLQQDREACRQLLVAQSALDSAARYLLHQPRVGTPKGKRI